eukprot:2885417-Pleurochrysis_carterae.AAC.1
MGRWGQCRPFPTSARCASRRPGEGGAALRLVAPVRPCEKRSAGTCDSCRVADAAPAAQRAAMPTDIVARVKRA